MKNFNLNINGVIVVNYEEKAYRCSIQDILEEYFSINVPVSNGELLLLEQGEQLDIEYCSESGTLYKFNAVVLERDITDKISMYRLSTPMNVRKIQRRNYVRVQVVKEALYRKNEEDSWCEGVVLDLSGGGIKIKSKDDFALNDKLFIKIETKSGGKFEAVGEIKRREKTGIYEYVYGLEFIDINENNRDKIVQEVFLVMRKQREIL